MTRDEASTYDLIAVGASWGGLTAISALLEGLPDDLDTPLVVAQHRSPESDALVSLLQNHTDRTVCEAGDKDGIRDRMVYVAPPDYHLLVERNEFALSVEERVQYARPSIDVLFETASDAYRERVIAIVLTGANADGALGATRVRDRGGIVVVQDPDEAERSEMPAAAIAVDAAEQVCPLASIAPFLRDACGAGRAA